MKASIIVFCTLILMAIWSCTGQAPKNINSIPPKVFAEKIKLNPKAQLIDVRTAEEFAGGHLDSAINVNWNSTDFEAKASKYDKSKPVFIYCRSGGRSAQAAAKLSEMGFEQVYDLEGGIANWNAVGY